MASLFWLVPHFRKNSLQLQYQLGKGKKCSQQLKVVLSINCAKNCLQPPGFIQRLPVNDLSKGQVLTGIGIHVQNIVNNCILKWELQYFVFQGTTSRFLFVWHALLEGKFLFFFFEDVLYQNVLLCGSANFSEFWRTKCFPPLHFVLCLILSWLWFRQKLWAK